MTPRRRRFPPGRTRLPPSPAAESLDLAAIRQLHEFRDLLLHDTQLLDDLLRREHGRIGCRIRGVFGCGALDDRHDYSPVPYRDRCESAMLATAPPIRPMIPEVRNLGSLTGNARQHDAGIRGKTGAGGAQLKLHVDRDGHDSSTCRVTPESGRTRLPVGRWFQNPALDLPAWLNRLWRLVKKLRRTQLFVKRRLVSGLRDSKYTT